MLLKLNCPELFEISPFIKVESDAASNNTLTFARGLASAFTIFPVIFEPANQTG